MGFFHYKRSSRSFPAFEPATNDLINQDHGHTARVTHPRKQLLVKSCGILSVLLTWNRLTMSTLKWDCCMSLLGHLLLVTQNEVIVIPSAQRSCEGCPQPPRGVSRVCAECPWTKPWPYGRGRWCRTCWGGAGEPWRLARARFQLKCFKLKCLNEEGME